MLSNKKFTQNSKTVLFTSIYTLTQYVHLATDCSSICILADTGCSPVCSDTQWMRLLTRIYPWGRRCTPVCLGATMAQWLACVVRSSNPPVFWMPDQGCSIFCTAQYIYPPRCFSVCKHVIPKRQIQLPIMPIITVIFLSFRTDRSGQTVQTQIRLLRVYTVCNPLCIFWMHYS